MGVEEKVLARIRPSADEEARIERVVRELLERLSSTLKSRGWDARPFLAGSVAKGTPLTGTEIDVFVAFPPDLPRADLESRGLALGTILEKGAHLYAEHPYTRGWYKGFEVEVVPCYRITDATQRLSAVDRTPLHVDYVLGHLQENQATEVRLLKAFAGGIGVYGAEAKIRGFSGYLCELLVLKHDTFRGVLEAAKSWHPGTKVEFETLAGRAFNEPFIVVDPVDGNRNVASAVSAEQLATFVHAAREYLAKPSDRFFFPRPLKPRSVAQLKATLRRRVTHLVVVSIPAPKLTEDVSYPQVRKAHKAILELVHRRGFVVMNAWSGIEGDEVLLLFEFEVFRLPRVELHDGPPVWVRNAEDFLRKWRRAKRRVAGPYIRGERWVVEVTREAVDAAAPLQKEVRALGLRPAPGRAGKAGARGSDRGG